MPNSVLYDKLFYGNIGYFWEIQSPFIMDKVVGMDEYCKFIKEKIVQCLFSMLSR